MHDIAWSNSSSIRASSCITHVLVEFCRGIRSTFAPTALATSRIGGLCLLLTTFGIFWVHCGYCSVGLGLRMGRVVQVGWRLGWGLFATFMLRTQGIRAQKSQKPSPVAATAPLRRLENHLHCDAFNAL